jgi:hypothetical protein
MNSPSDYTARKKDYSNQKNFRTFMERWQPGLPDGILSYQKSQFGPTYFVGTCNDKFRYI